MRLLLCLFSFMMSGYSQNIGAPFQEASIFISGQEGYNTFRIPAIVKAANGDLLAFCEGRVTSTLDFGNIDIVMKRSTDLGKTWGALKVIANNGTLLAGNPVPVLDKTDSRYPNGRLFLHYNTSTTNEAAIKNGNGIREAWYTTSTDHGVTWSAPVNITLSVNKPNEPTFNPAYNFSEDWRWYANGPCHGIQHSTGRLVIPGNHSVGAGMAEIRSHVYFSDDHGTTWKIGGQIGINTNESSVVELVNHDLMINMRRVDASSNNLRGVSISRNRGLTWDSVTSDTALIESRCQASILRFTDTSKFRKNRILFSNPRAVTRTNMTVQMSYDEGKTWPIRREIYSGSSAYSDLVITDSLSIGLMYEKDNYATIRFAHFTLPWLSNGVDSLDKKGVVGIRQNSLAENASRFQLLTGTPPQWRIFVGIKGSNRIRIFQLDGTEYSYKIPSF